MFECLSSCTSFQSFPSKPFFFFFSFVVWFVELDFLN